ILVWPVEELKEDFVREFRDLIPIEREVQFPTAEEDEIESALRNRYRDYIGEVLPSIAEIAKAKWTAKFDSPRGGGMGMGGMGADMYGGEMPGGDMYGSGDMYGGAGMPGGPGGQTPRDEGPLVSWDTGSQEKLLSD